MDARTDGRTDRCTNGRKMITIAHPEHSSGELKKQTKKKKNSLLVMQFLEMDCCARRPSRYKALHKSTSLMHFLASCKALLNRPLHSSETHQNANNFETWGSKHTKKTPKQTKKQLQKNNKKQTNKQKMAN